jgi:hypothetical protein
MAVLGILLTRPMLANRDLPAARAEPVIDGGPWAG